MLELLLIGTVFGAALVAAWAFSSAAKNRQEIAGLRARIALLDQDLAEARSRIGVVEARLGTGKSFEVL